MSRVTYRAIQQEVLARIRRKTWQPGALIPTEAALAAEFGCARATINRALRELAETGIIERRRKAGTRVSATPVRKATLEIPVTRLEVEARGATYRHKVLERREIPAPAHLIARMNLAANARLLHLKTLHLADAHPFLFEDRFINPLTATGIKDAPLESISANEWLVRNIPISGGDITFLAEPATPEDAAALDVATGCALFIINRLTWAGIEAVTQVRLAYPPGYAMTTKI